MTTLKDDQNAILAVIREMTAALGAKDATRALSCLAEDAVVFDLAPPLQSRPRREDGTADLDSWFATWTGPIVVEDRDTHVEAYEEIGFAYALRHLTGTKTDGEQVDLWFRVTMGARRESNGWRLAHIHESVPFAMDGSGLALLDLRP